MATKDYLENSDPPSTLSNLAFLVDSRYNPAMVKPSWEPITPYRFFTLLAPLWIPGGYHES